jgi:hypothetical protein
MHKDNTMALTSKQFAQKKRLGRRLGNFFVQKAVIYLPFYLKKLNLQAQTKAGPVAQLDRATDF